MASDPIKELYLMNICTSLRERINAIDAEFNAIKKRNKTELTDLIDVSVLKLDKKLTCKQLSKMESILNFEIER